VKTCGMGGEESEHELSMEWDPAKYTVGINNIVEPFWAPQALRYELFGGITIMELTVNHIIRLLKIGLPPTLGRWLLPENQEQKKLVITHVEKGKYAGRVLAPGMVINKVNNKEIGTLDEYRKVFMPPDGQTTWTLETDRGVLYVTDFKETLVQQISQAEAGMTYMFCESVVKAAQQMLGHKQGAQPDSSMGSLAQTASANVKSLPIADAADRMTGVPKREALSMFAGTRFAHDGQADDEFSSENAHRMARVSHVSRSMMTLAASEYAPDAILGASSGLPMTIE
jgi:hypothetical protein